SGNRFDVLTDRQRSIPFDITDAEAAAQINHLERQAQLGTNGYREPGNLVHGHAESFHLENLGSDMGMYAEHFQIGKGDCLLDGLLGSAVAKIEPELGILLSRRDIVMRVRLYARRNAKQNIDLLALLARDGVKQGKLVKVVHYEAADL